MAPFSNRALNYCSITRTCWGATSVENTHINLGGRDANCIDTLFQYFAGPNKIYWQKFPCCQISTRGASLSRLVSGFICSCAVRTTSNRQDASGLTTLKPSSEGAGNPRPLRFRVDLKICVCRRPLRPEAHEVAGLAERSPEDTEGEVK